MYLKLYEIYLSIPELSIEKLELREKIANYYKREINLINTNNDISNIEDEIKIIECKIGLFD